ncbi:MAG: lysophospholipid acyltransferase family protein [Deltaproteobacteria bacterium]|nr:lysophospholipid acyltransferase family protein [Deltaproteobacteria bacterium]
MFSPAKTLQHLAEWAFLGGLSVTARVLPLAWLSPLGAALGWVVYHVLPLKRGLTENNIRLALGNSLPPGGVERTAARCYRFFGSLLFQVPAMARLARRPSLLPYVTVENPQVLSNLLAQGRGVVLLSGHFGHWELICAALARQGFSITMYVGRQHNPRADDWINRLRRGFGIVTVAEGASMRALLKALREKGVVAMLGDQHNSRQENFVRFFGRLVSAVPGPAALAMRTGAALVFSSAAAEAPFRYRVRLEELPWTPTGEEEWDQLAITQMYFQRMEQIIRDYPEQYFWMHNRWKEMATHNLTPVNRRFLDLGAP